MKSVLKALKWFGVVIQVHPFDAMIAVRRSILWKVSCVISVATQMILYVVPVLVFLDTSLNSSYLKKYYLHLSTTIEMGLWYVGVIASYTIIRICSMIYRHDLLILFNSLTFRYPGFRASWSQNKFLLGFSMVLSVLWFLSCSENSISYHLGAHWSPKCDFLLLPCDESVIKSVSIISELLEVVSILYAWNWIMFYGAALVARLDQFSKSCQMLLRDISTNPATEQPTISDESVIQVLLHEFRCIREDYWRYRRVGGAYALGVVVHLVVQIMAFLYAGFIRGVTVADWWGPFSVYSLILCFISAITVLYLGEYVIQSVTFIF